MPNNKTKRCDVLMLVDVEMGETNAAGRFVPDGGTMEVHVYKALCRRFDSVVIVPFGPDIPATLTRLKQLNPRIIFNLTEWVDSDRTQDFAIAALLDMMKFKYTGTGPAGLQLARDKAGSKELVAAAGVDGSRPVVTSCGSGVTACILTLGLRLSGLPEGAVYDGSWTEWGGRADTPVETN